MGYHEHRRGEGLGPLRPLAEVEDPPPATRRRADEHLIYQAPSSPTPPAAPRRCGPAWEF